MNETENVAPIETNESIDLRNTLSAAFEQAESREESQEDEPTARARDERGRFAAKAQESEAVDAPTEPASSEPTPAEPVASDAPASWGASGRDLWGKLPPEAQAFIREREAEVHRGFTRQDEERTFGRTLRQVIQPYEKMIRADGGEPAAAVQNLLHTAATLRAGSPEQKIELFRQVAREYGVDLSRVYDPNAPQPDPRLQTLEQRVAAFERAQEAQRMAEATRQEQALHAEIQQFRDARDAAGTAKHPHFETVRADMAALMAAGRAQSLDDAYDMACWARPDLRSTLLAAEQAKEQAKQQQAAAERARKARAAGSSITGAPGITAPAAADGAGLSLREQLEAAANAARI